MNTIRLTFANLKRYIKSPSLLSGMILMPALLIGFSFFSAGDSDSPMYLAPVAIVGDIDGKYEKKLINELELKDNLFKSNDKDKAIDLLKNNKVSAVFIFNKTFSNDIDVLKRPTIQCIKTDEGGGSLWIESKIESFINDSLKYKIDPHFNSKITSTKVVENEKTSSDPGIVVSVFLICYSMYINASYLCSDLLNLRTSNVLRRMISTKNKDIEILLSIFLSIFILQSIVYCMILLFIKIISGFDMGLSMILLIMANSFTSTGLVILITRIFKNSGAISMVVTFYAIIGLGLSLPTLIPSIGFNIPILVNISKFTPFYWNIDALKSDNISLNIIVLLLLGLSFITAGSFKLRDFAKN